MIRFNATERLGIYKSATVFTENLGWIFREQPLVDVGIDALIEEAVNGNPTGKFLAAQVKTGVGNFLPSGNSYILYVSRIHCNYWLNLDLPIILLAYIPEEDKISWETINKETLKQTKKRWKLEISKYKILGKSSTEELTNLIYRKPYKDFLTRLKNKEISEEELIKITETPSLLYNVEDSIERLSEIIVTFDQGQTEFIKEADLCIENSYSKTHPKVKAIIAKFSQIISSTSYELEREIHIFSDSFAIAFRNLEKLSLVYFYITNDYEHLKNNLNQSKSLELQINNSLEAIKSLKKSISEFPNTYLKLKIAKKNLIETLDLMISEFNVSKEMSLKFQIELEKIVN